MDARTLEALKASIAKWERNAKAETPDEYLTGPGECALCHLFRAYPSCGGCPVADHTGLHGCARTPYSDAEDYHDEWASGDKSAAADALSAARAEVAFLKSLLPTEEMS